MVFFVGLPSSFSDGAASAGAVDDLSFRWQVVHLAVFLRAVFVGMLGLPLPKRSPLMQSSRWIEFWALPPAAVVVCTGAVPAWLAVRAT